MIVRTYARRNRSFSDSSFSGEFDDCFYGSLSQDSSQDAFRIGFSSQESSSWLSDSDLHRSAPHHQPESMMFSPQDVSQERKDQKPKKPRNGTYESNSWKKVSDGVLKVPNAISFPPTATLMEAQESGEMMEHVDEVNFALDGLMPGQPTRIRHASLSSLLSICMIPQQCHLLRAQGMAKTIIDSILALNFDDSPSILAAATLFYILSSDGHDDLLDTYSCVQFLLKLLNLSVPDTDGDKIPPIEGKILSLQKDFVLLRKTSKKFYSTPISLLSMINKILPTCKEIDFQSADNENTGQTELNAKWVALLTMERACLSTVSLEDTSGAVRMVGGNFKERLRELGGLEAVSDVASDCFASLKDHLDKALAPSSTSKNEVILRSITFLQKCLKIMENATFLSKDNQNHLLGMNAETNSCGPSLSFVRLVISCIKVLSSFYLLHNPPRGISATDESSNSKVGRSTWSCHSSDVPENEDQEGCTANVSSSSSGNFCSTEKKRRRGASTAITMKGTLCKSYTSGSESHASPSDLSSTVKGNISYVIQSSMGEFDYSGTNTLGLQQDPINMREVSSEELDETQVISLEEGQDPFEFDEYDSKPTRWDLLGVEGTVSISHRNRGKSLQVKGSEKRSSVKRDSGVIDHSCEISESSVLAEDANLLGDCLLTAVKVLMNLTNDNPIGCQQIASCGGLDTMASLIMCHFPMFGPRLDTKMPGFVALSTYAANIKKCKHLREFDLDFLVAILGLLVNLVEKDSKNRSRLAGTSVLFPVSRAAGITRKGVQKQVIPFLCSIFLANQGGDDSPVGKLPWNHEAAILEGEKEAERMIVEAYAALLLAFLSMESVSVRNTIAGCLPDQNLGVLVPVLERFLAFHLTLNMISSETHATVSKVIESCKRQ